MTPILEMTGIGKAFGGNQVLQDVSFRVGAGEIVALLGANGAGKSTLMKILTSVYARDTGTIRIDGAEAHFGRPADALARGIRLLPQELSVMPDMTVAENILLADLPLRRFGPLRRVDRAAMRARVGALLQTLGLEMLDPRAIVRSLSVSEQRIVEIARALAGNARIIILDEPTASLAERERAQLFAVMRRLRETGTGVVFISHYLDEVFAISDRIEVLRDGRNAGSFATADTTSAEVVTVMLGRSGGELFPPHARGSGEVVLAARNLANGRLLNDVNLDIRAGEIHGVFGLIGSGIEELGKTLFGALPRTGGTVTEHGSPFAPRRAGQAISRGVGLAAAERKSEGILPDLTVRENLTLPFLGRFGGLFTVARGRERDFARARIRDLGIRTAGPEQQIRFLSGGNQQKVCIGRWLVEGVDFLILEEPTRGVDLGARRDIYERIRRLTDDGMAVLLISSDAEEVAGLADRITVLRAGCDVHHFERPTTPHQLMHAAGEAAA